MQLFIILVDFRAKSQYFSSILPKNRQFSIQLTHQNRQHLIVDIPIHGESSAALFMAGQLADDVRTRSFLVEIADESATGKVAAGDVAYTSFLFFTRHGIALSHFNV